MNTDIEDAEQDAVSQRAAQWLIRLSAGNPADRPAFVQWLKKSPRHVEEFLLMSAVCKGLAGTGPGDMAGIEQLIAEAQNAPSNVVPLPFGGGERSDAASPHPIQTNDGALKGPGGGPVTRMPRWAALAAGVAFLGLGVIWAAPRIATYLNTYSTAMGEQRTVRLPDGSMVYMNARSRISVDYSDAVRDIRLLDGEAIFKVERVPDRPFRVHARTTTIQALGTQFNVYRRAEGDTVVSVIDGAVRVSRTPHARSLSSSVGGPTSASASALQLSAGEEARVAPSGAIVKRDRADLPRTTAWRERRLVFREDRLENIAAEFARYSPHRIVVEDEVARNKRITGTFDADDPVSLIQFLEKLDELSVERLTDEFLVRGR